MIVINIKVTFTQSRLQYVISALRTYVMYRPEAFANGRSNNHTTTMQFQAALLLTEKLNKRQMSALLRPTQKGTCNITFNYTDGYILHEILKQSNAPDAVSFASIINIINQINKQL